MSIPTLNWVKNRLRLIDQTRLPLKLRYIDCCDVTCVWKAIRTLKVRGAPAIGVAAGFGVYLGMRDSQARTYPAFKKELSRVLSYLANARPTAINLFWSLERMRTVIEKNKTKSIPQLKQLIFLEAQKIMEEDKFVCHRLADYGVKLIKDGDTILTYCNAGALATADYGTALAAVYRAGETGIKVKVFACETRPFLQGARLTAWELKQNKIPVTLICDNMAAALMAQGKVDKVFVGSDRTVANGDTANKVGTYNLAVLAKYHKIPFYVVSPLSSFDLSLRTGKDIPIEERPGKELVEFMGKRIAPYGIDVYYPCFDITPGDLITAIVTEKGIFRPPYSKSLRRIRESNEDTT
jgi:methylthioribose-1-phosphate isomerase